MIACTPFHRKTPGVFDGLHAFAVSVGMDVLSKSTPKTKAAEAASATPGAPMLDPEDDTDDKKIDLKQYEKYKVGEERYKCEK